MGEAHTAENDTGRYATREDAEKAIAHYNANRCPCGGAPLWVEDGLHSVAWHDEHGWPERVIPPEETKAP